MPAFRCGTVHHSRQGPGSHSPAGPCSRSWARYLQAGGAANLHRLHDAAPKQLRRHAQSFAIFASTASTKTASPPPKAAHASEEQILDCVIVGAGISGLTLAQALASDHSNTVKNFLITEAQDRVGGNIISKRTDEGFQYEEGPNSFQPSDAVLKLAVSSDYNFQMCHIAEVLLLPCLPHGQLDANPHKLTPVTCLSNPSYMSLAG